MGINKHMGQKNTDRKITDGQIAAILGYNGQIWAAGTSRLRSRRSLSRACSFLWY